MGFICPFIFFGDVNCISPSPQKPLKNYIKRKRILKINLQSVTPDTIVLQRPNTASSEILPIRNQMRWAGQITRMQKVKLLKQLFNRELQHVRCPKHKPERCFKDVVKSNLRVLSMNIEDWEKIIVNRSTSIYESYKAFEAWGIKYSS